MFKSEAVTNGVRVRVTSRYSAERSEPQRSRWFFHYTVQITNESPQKVRLASRHWIIVDANGHREDVRGPGVVGQQPALQPGESFQYTSGCPLSTPFGSMQGTYQMVVQDGTQFDAQIAPFTLSEPIKVH